MNIYIYIYVYIAGWSVLTEIANKPVNTITSLFAKLFQTSLVFIQVANDTQH